MFRKERTARRFPQATLASFKALVSEHTGLVIKDRDRDKVAETISRRMQTLDLGGPDQYLSVLRRGDSASRREWEILSNALTVGESYFFRDKGQISLLRERILPELVEAAKGVRRLRFWSAGCSTGEEVYSLAILVDEALPDSDEWDIAVLGTDINTEALEKARAGTFNQWSFRGMDDTFKSRYFSRDNGQWKIGRRWRQHVHFASLNLRHTGFPNPALKLAEIDLIVCRNVFIYFDLPTIRRVAERMASTLRRGGYLLTGHAELGAAVVADLEQRTYPGSTIYQRPAAPPLSKNPPPPQPKAAVGSRRPLGPGSAGLTDALKAGREQPARTDDRGANARDGQDETSEAFLRMARDLADLGRYTEAQQYCQQLLHKDPMIAEAYYLMAHIAEDRGDKEAAKTHLKRVIYLQPERIAPYLELAEVYEGLGEALKARIMRASALGLLQNMDALKRIEPYGDTAEALAMKLKESMGGDV